MSRAILSIAIVAMFVSASVAQHTGGGGGGSSAGSSGGGSGGHSSSGGSYSSGGGGGHSSGGGSSSGGSHSGSGPSGSHSSGGSGGHVSGGSVSHISGGIVGGGSSAGHVTSSGGVAILPSASPHSQGISGVDERGRSFTLDRNTSRHVDEMIRNGKSVDEIRDFLRTRPAGTTTNLGHTEKRGFLAALRHPFRGPEPHYAVDLRHRICLQGTCKVCPAGTTAGANGTCSGSELRWQVPNFCTSGSYWSVNSCVVLAQQYRWNDCNYPADPELLAAKRKMDVLRSQMNDACRGDAASRACADMNFAYQQAVGQYNVRRDMHQRLFDRCLQGSPFGYFDPIDPQN